MQLSNKTIVQVLRKEYPDVIDKITSEYVADLPDNKLTDFSLILQIIESFKKIRGIHVKSFKNEIGQKKITDERILLLAVILLFFNPERLYGIKRHDHLKISNAVSKLTDTSQVVLTKSLNDAVLSIKAYKDFKKEVYRLYELIKQENKFFNYG